MALEYLKTVLLEQESLDLIKDGFLNKEDLLFSVLQSLKKESQKFPFSLENMPYLVMERLVNEMPDGLLADLFDVQKEDVRRRRVNAGLVNGRPVNHIFNLLREAARTMLREGADPVKVSKVTGIDVKRVRALQITQIRSGMQTGRSLKN